MTKSKANTNEFTITAFIFTALTLCVMTLNKANAEVMPYSKYLVLDKNNNHEFMAAKNRCEPLKSNAKTLCDAKTEAVRDIAKADLEAIYKPTIQNRYEANMIRAGAAFSIAIAQCYDAKLIEQNICEKNATELRMREVANARAQRNREKLAEIKKDKALKFNVFNDESNAFSAQEFNDIYRVKT